MNEHPTYVNFWSAVITNSYCSAAPGNSQITGRSSQDSLHRMKGEGDLQRLPKRASIIGDYDLDNFNTSNGIEGWKTDFQEADRKTRARTQNTNPNHWKAGCNPNVLLDHNGDYARRHEYQGLNGSGALVHQRGCAR